MNSEAIFDLFRIIILAFILSGCIRMICRKKNIACVVFFTLGIACILLSECYWLTYDILRPDSRMPFAANEIGEWSLFLLLGSALSALHPSEYMKYKKEMAMVVLFVGGNVALWIGWSGEWIQDILTGVTFSCFLFALVCRIKREDVLKGGKGIVTVAAGFLLLLGQAVTFLVPEGTRKILDMGCYALMFTVLFILIVETVWKLVKKQNSQTMCFSFISFAWCVVTLYMSSGTFYLAAMVFSAVCFILMYVALKREVLGK